MKILLKHIIAIIITITCINTTGYTQDFEISPVRLMFNAEPGESQTKYIMVKNHSNKTETFIINVGDYNINNKGEGEYLDAGSLKNSIADWVSIAPSFFELEPNAEKEITVTLQQPANDYGSKWGVLFFRTAQEQTAYSADKSLQTSMSVSARIVVDIYQTPGSNKNYKVTIGHLSEIITESDSIKAYSAVVNNLENIITNCKVFLVATDVQTGVERTYPPTEFIMMPKSSRKVYLEIPNDLKKGTYSIAAILDYGSRTNLEGTQIIITVD